MRKKKRGRTYFVVGVLSTKRSSEYARDQRNVFFALLCAMPVLAHSNWPFLNCWDAQKIVRYSRNVIVFSTIFYETVFRKHLDRKQANCTLEFLKYVFSKEASGMCCLKYKIPKFKIILTV